MNPHELILLSPYRVPGQSSLMIGNEDVGAFLNGMHGPVAPGRRSAAPPARRASAPPTTTSSRPPTTSTPCPTTRRCSCPTTGTSASATPAPSPSAAPSTARQRWPTCARPCARRGDGAPPAHLIDLPPERVAPFFGIGFGYLHLDGAVRGDGAREPAGHRRPVVGGAAGHRRPRQRRRPRGAGVAISRPPPTAFRRARGALPRHHPPPRPGAADEARLGEPLPAAFDAGPAAEPDRRAAACWSSWPGSNRSGSRSLKERVSADQVEVVRRLLRRARGRPAAGRIAALEPAQGQERDARPAGPGGARLRPQALRLPPADAAAAQQRRRQPAPCCWPSTRR